MSEGDVRSEWFNHSDPITILSFLVDLRMTFNNAALHEGAAILIISYVLGMTPHHAYKARRSSPDNA